MYLAQEPLRCVTDWLAGTRTDYANVDQGVNAQLAAIPRDAGDPAPAALVAIEDETRSPAVARRRLPNMLPGLGLGLHKEFGVQGEVQTVYRDTAPGDTVDIAIAFGVLSTALEAGLRDAGYMVRAIVRSLRELHRNENVAARTRNGIVMVSCRALVILPPFRDPEDASSQVVAACVASYDVRDTAP